MRFRSRLAAGFAGALLFAASLLGAGAFAQESASTGPVIVFAAASLKNALDGAAGAWERESGSAARSATRPAPRSPSSWSRTRPRKSSFPPTRIG